MIKVEIRHESPEKKKKERGFKTLRKFWFRGLIRMSHAERHIRLIEKARSNWT